MDSHFQDSDVGLQVFLTQASWDITDIVSVDSNDVYFLGTGGNATQRHLYRFNTEIYSHNMTLVHNQLGEQIRITLHRSYSLNSKIIDKSF